MIIDAREFGCPLPVTMAKAALSKVVEGTVEILVGGDEAVENLDRFAKTNGMSSESERIEDYWKVRITKGKAALTPAEAPRAEEKRLFLIVGTDSLGKDEELGRSLMKGFFETMRATGDAPHTIFFLNAGVKLTTIRGAIHPILKELQDSGVEIYSCGTCLKFYGLESELKAGSAGSMYQTVEALNRFKVVWL